MNTSHFPLLVPQQFAYRWLETESLIMLKLAIISPKFMLQQEKTKLYGVQDGFILLKVRHAELQEEQRLIFISKEESLCLNVNSWKNTRFNQDPVYIYELTFVCMCIIQSPLLLSHSKENLRNRMCLLLQIPQLCQLLLSHFYSDISGCIFFLRKWIFSIIPRKLIPGKIRFPKIIFFSHSRVIKHHSNFAKSYQ